ncbi:hypothetical protein SMALA_3856 [Streptomyces malaysiensis subsp. malaysiensis]|nr:hypothetical protein SMALA_3856 [Streptomyces malaysiensis]
MRRLSPRRSPAPGPGAGAAGVRRSASVPTGRIGFTGRLGARSSLCWSGALWSSGGLLLGVNQPQSPLFPPEPSLPADDVVVGASMVASPRTSFCRSSHFRCRNVPAIPRPGALVQVRMVVPTLSVTLFRAACHAPSPPRAHRPEVWGTGAAFPLC